MRSRVQRSRGVVDRRAQEHRPAGEGVKGKRIAYSPDLGHARVDPEVAALVKAAVARFAELGAVVEEVATPWAKDGPDLIVWGSSTLTPVLLEHGLADEVLLLVYPVLLGTGKRFFSDGAPPRELALVGTKASSSGVVISTYRPSGPLRTGSFDDGAA